MLLTIYSQIYKPAVCRVATNVLNCRVLKLEDLFELAGIHEGDLTAPVQTFSLPSSKIEIGDEPSLMGVVNLSPDSWYRESVCLNTNDAISRGKMLVAQGAAIVDVGGESTLLGAERVDAIGQSARLLPVITSLSDAGVAVSAETYNPEVAKLSLEAGASIINLTGSGDAEAIYESVSSHEAAVIICFVQGANAREVEDLKLDDDPVPMLLDYFGREIERAKSAGVNRIIIDPGLGFYYRNLEDSADRVRHQMSVFLNTFRLRQLGWPVCHALPHAFEYFGEEVRTAESFFAVLAALGKTSLFRTHEVPKVRAVLETLRAY